MVRIPLFGSMRELGPPPRYFLLFVAVNVVSWQNIVGPSMVLLARKIGMPEFFVGMMLSFLPFTSVLMLLTLPWVPRLGPKRLMMWAWGLRNVICCVVFTLPLALAWGSPRLSWVVFGAAILGFCVMRALGAGGWLPWLHEIVPAGQRSAYFSSETAVTQVINVLIMLAQAALLAGGDAGIDRFLAIYAIGILMGFWSLLWMRRIPGGDAIAGMSPIRLREEVQTCAAAVRDTSFLKFMLVASFGISSMCWFGAANVMYMRDVLRLPDSVTMSINALASLGVLFTVGSPWTGYGMAGVMVLGAVFCAAFNVAANRAMLNQVPETNRVGYTAVWTVITALALGVTPLLAGAVIGAWGLRGFQTCFVISSAWAVLAGIVSLWTVRDSHLVPPSVTAMLNPLLPLRTLGRILWITVGLDESNTRPPAE